MNQKSLFQASTLKTYPAELSLTAGICLMGTIEGAIVAVVMERGNPSAWAIGWDMKLLTVTYSVRFIHVTQKLACKCAQRWDII